MNPTDWPLVAWSGWFASVALAGIVYGRSFRRFRWPIWRGAVFVLGCALTLGAAWGLNNPLASMTDYTIALMALGQVVSPFLLLGFPRAERVRWHEGANRIWSQWLLDAWVAAAVFVVLTLGINLPGIFNTALMNALFSAPIGVLVMLAGLMIWAQLLEGTRATSRRWIAGVYGWLVGLPMMAIGAVWVWSDHVLYTPYLNVLCLWNLSPLDDQHYAGLVMLIAGLPLQLRSAWLLIMPSAEEGVEV